MNKQQKPYEGDKNLLEVKILINGIVSMPHDSTFKIWDTSGIEPYKSSWWDNELYNVLRGMTQDQIYQHYITQLWLFQKNPKVFVQSLQWYLFNDIEDILNCAVLDNQLSTSRKPDSLIEQYIDAIDDYIAKHKDFSPSLEGEYQTDEFNDLLGSLELLDNEENEDSQKLIALLENKRPMIDMRSQSLIHDFFEVIKDEFPYDIPAIKKQIEIYQQKNPTSLLWEYFKTFIPMK